MTVVTRFAPSPTGYLHIGSARTALFNYLFARHHGGKYRLRIEDTDRARSTKEAVDAILNGLAWMGIQHDDEVVYQFSRKDRHFEVAQQLVASGNAYYCYTSQEELSSMRAASESEGKQFKFQSPWRDKSSKDAPSGVKPAIRLRVNHEGTTVINDVIQGKVVVPNTELDDMILVRSDGTPTYMHAVVVDDHDMNVTHIIRGDDHLTNAARQIKLFEALGYDIPVFAHIPLIHGPDGAKLSKRHGALGVEGYRDMGYLQETMCNYLMRLGWSHGNEEIISMEDAIKWFSLETVGKAPSRLDFKKLDHLNQHYIKEYDDAKLVDLAEPFYKNPLSKEQKELLQKAMKGLKPRAKTLVELAKNSEFYVAWPIEYNEKAQNVIANKDVELYNKLINLLTEQDDYTESVLLEKVKEFCAENNAKLGDVSQVLRSYLTGSDVSPSVFEIMHVLGKEESLKRLRG